MAFLEDDVATGALKEVVEELYISEKVYHEELTKLSELYILHLKTYVVSGEELEKLLLSKIKDFIDVSSSVFKEIYERLEEWDEDTSQLGDLFLEKAVFWDLYRYYASNLPSAISKFNEKMKSPDFAALVALRQGLNNPSLEQLILVPMFHLVEYKRMFGLYLERTVSADFTFSHPDFSNAMACKKLIEEILPDDLNYLIFQTKIEEYQKIESMLGDLAPEFTAFIKHVHEEPAASKRWKKKSAHRKAPVRSKSDILMEKELAAEKIDIGGQKYAEDSISPDILNAVRKERESLAMAGIGIGNGKSKSCDKLVPAHYLIKLEDKVKIKWESEVHTYSLVLFKQCVILAKIKNKTMKISRIIELKKMWVAEYEDGFYSGSVENKEHVCIGGWLEIDGLEDDEYIHRVVFTFPSTDIRNYWYILLRRQIEESKEKLSYRSGQIEVCYKASYSNAPPPAESRHGSGMSQQLLDISMNDDVSRVIELAVGKCQMKESKSSYKLMFIILQNDRVVCEAPLIDREFPLVIQNDTKSMYTDGRKVQVEVLFVLRHHNLLTSEPVPNRHRHNTLTTFFRGRIGGRTPSSRMSTAPEITRQPQSETPVGTMFGISLSQFMSQPCEIPAPLMDILSYMYSHCYAVEGILRSPGLKKMEKSVKARLDNGEHFDWNAEQGSYSLPNVAASLLKSYFRSLPEGLFLKLLFPEFERWREISDVNAKVPEMKAILAKMPEQNAIVAKHLFYVLKKIEEHSHLNKMDTRNVSICIGNSLIMWPEDANSLRILADAESQLTPNVAVHFLLQNVDEFFGPKPPIFGTEVETTCKSDVEEEECSRVSKISEDEEEDEDGDDSSDDDKSNLWLRSLLRNSVNESHSPSSSMFVEVGSPTSPKLEKRDSCNKLDGMTSPKLVKNNSICSPKQVRADNIASPRRVKIDCITPPVTSTPATPTPVNTERSMHITPRLTSKVCVMEKPRTQTVHSHPLPIQVSQSTAPQHCTGEADHHCEKDHRKIFNFSVKKSKTTGDNIAKPDGDVSKKKRGSSLRKSKKKGTEEKSAKLPEASSEDDERRALFDRNDQFRKHCTKPSAQKDNDIIQQVKECAATAKRVLVKQSNSFKLSQSEKPTVTKREPDKDNRRVEVKEGHDLAQLVSSLEKLTAPKPSYRRHFSGSLESGTDSGSSNEEDSIVNIEQESYV